MPWYRVMIHGEDFFLDEDWEARGFGFYTARFVEASAEADAKRKAIAQIHEDGAIGAQLEDDDPLATLTIEELCEVGSTSIPERIGGFTFYRQDSND